MWMLFVKVDLQLDIHEEIQTLWQCDIIEKIITMRLSTVVSYACLRIQSTGRCLSDRLETYLLTLNHYLHSENS